MKNEKNKNRHNKNQQQQQRKHNFFLYHQERDWALNVLTKLKHSVDWRSTCSFCMPFKHNASPNRSIFNTKRTRNHNVIAAIKLFHLFFHSIFLPILFFFHPFDRRIKPLNHHILNEEKWKQLMLTVFAIFSRFIFLGLILPEKAAVFRIFLQLHTYHHLTKKMHKRKEWW